MRPDAFSVLAAFLAVGGLQLVVAQDAPEAHVQRPRWYFPQEVKRTIRRNAEPDPGSILDGLFDNLKTTQGSSSAATTTPDSSVAAQPQKGQEVVVVTISVDPKNPEITHRITGTTIIGGEPTGTTTMTTHTTEGSSAEVTSKKSSEALSADAETTRKQGSVIDSSVKASTTPTSTKASSDGAIGDLTSGLGNLLAGDSTSSTATTTSKSSSKTTLPASSSTAAASSSSGLGGLAEESTSTSSAAATSTSPSNASKISSASSSVASGMTTSGSDLLDLLGLGDKSSAGNSTSAPVPSSASSSRAMPVSVSASATSLLPTTTGTATSTAGDFVGSFISSVDSLVNATSTSTGSTALIPTASMSGGSLLPLKSTGLIPGPTGTNTGVIPTPTNTLGSVPVPHSHGSESTTFGSETVSGSPTASGPLFGTTTASASSSGAYEGSKAPVSTSHPTSAPRPLLTSTTSTSEEVSTAQPTVEPQIPTSTLPPPTNDNDWMPSTILIVPTMTATQTSTSGESAKPTAPSLPGSITPSNEVSEAPADSILLQLGFNSQLPWSFVATTPLSSSQIFNYTPQAIENALPALSAKDGPVMFAIEPYYNWKITGYNATIAIFYFPRDKVDALQALKINPNSALYKQDSESIKSLMAMVDPTIPLEFSGNYPSGNSGSTDGNNHGGSDNGPDSGNNDNTDGSAGSSKAKASSVGIGVGVVAGAAAYGAGMFWVARRYRKRKQLHQRSSSTVEQMSQGGSAAGSMFAAGGRVPSHGSRGTARSQMISAPVMAENSLGWN
ncbi:hypothetical protein N7463_006041 [Penicillium fimorum]|uniref:Uncharacterized protein n=1 Tax=Penicillium fimorum TaxID=1882269 RepID=A0A9X0C5S4_9EURO|nr:hypothetical protein N7463_006041 [Penicillium fimorum]